MIINMKSKATKYMVWSIFLVYLVLLVKVVLFKYPLDIMRGRFLDRQYSLDFIISHNNFIPMKSISYYLSGRGSTMVAAANLLGNIIIFAPLGFLLPIISDYTMKFKNIFVTSFLITLTFETFQLITATGAFDVDDIILNVLGGAMGYFIYEVYKFAYDKRTNMQHA